jgi:hypothetical protein
MEIVRWVGKCQGKGPMKNAGIGGFIYWVGYPLDGLGVTRVGRELPPVSMTVRAFFRSEETCCSFDVQTAASYRPTHVFNFFLFFFLTTHTPFSFLLCTIA